MSREVKTEDYEGYDRRTDSKLTWWIMGIIGALFLAGATAWANDINMKVSRVLALETKVGSIDESLGTIQRILERLEDRVIYNERSIKGDR